jgi:hypothetical protein
MSANPATYGGRSSDQMPAPNSATVATTSNIDTACKINRGPVKPGRVASARVMRLNKAASSA